jgi:hypothetical protein
VCAYCVACCSQYVEVEPPRYPKRYLGGFRNTLTGVEYHHASVQTLHPPLKTDGPCQKDRDTQTIHQRNVYQQTANDMATQMTGVGVYVENITDKLIKPSFYTTADEYLRNRLKHVIIKMISLLISSVLRFYCLVYLPLYGSRSISTVFVLILFTSMETFFRRYRQL